MSTQDNSWATNVLTWFEPRQKVLSQVHLSTGSFRVSKETANNLNQIMEKVDVLLYEAKQAGKKTSQS